MMSPPQGATLYRGTPRIKLTSLYCDLSESDEYEKKEKVRKLCKILEALPDYASPQYHVAAVIDDGLLKNAIELSKTSREVLFSCHDQPVKLDLPRPKMIQCVAGRSIIKAAQKTNKEWWVVKLYAQEGMCSRPEAQARANLLGQEWMRALYKD